MGWENMLNPNLDTARRGQLYRARCASTKRAQLNLALHLLDVRDDRVTPARPVRPETDLSGMYNQAPKMVKSATI